MSIDELDKKIMAEETLSPKEIIDSIEFNDLVAYIIDMSTAKEKKLAESKLYYENYLQLINYIYSIKLKENQVNKNRKTELFKDTFIHKLLTLKTA